MFDDEFDDMSSGEATQRNREEVKEIIRGFLSRNEFLHEFRLQKLVYLAELISAAEREERLTDADYKPYMYGAYSEDVSKALKEMDDSIETKADLRHGKVVTSYRSRGDSPELSDDIEDILDRVQSLVANLSSEELGEWSKETWLYENTPYGEPMNFEKYIGSEVGEQTDVAALKEYL